MIQPVSCIQTFNPLSKQYDNRFDNRLYRVNGVWEFKLPSGHHLANVKQAVLTIIAQLLTVFLGYREALAARDQLSVQALLTNSPICSPQRQTFSMEKNKRSWSHTSTPLFTMCCSLFTIATCTRHLAVISVCLILNCCKVFCILVKFSGKVLCWHGYLSGARCKWFTYGPADVTAIPSSLAPVKSRILWISSQGYPSIGDFNARGVAKYSEFGRCKIGGKLVLITNRKSYTSFRLVRKLVTLNGLVQRNFSKLCYPFPGVCFLHW